MTKSLVIVESPAKARTIAGFLGDGYVVESSIGHIRDLPKRAGDVPAKYKKAAWARLGVDVDNDFRPLYVVDPDKKEHLKRLKSLLAGSSELLLATDEDREGESIAWHLLEVLEPTVPVKRMVFHEITKKAIQQAIDSPRDIDRHLVDAQEARRILDRLYGYEVSPVLWKKVMPKLSAGRVQSVATRIIVARERERMRFRAATYWDLDGTFAPEGGDEKVNATSVTVDGKRLATGKDFDEGGRITKDDILLLDEASAQGLVTALAQRTAKVRSVDRKPQRRTPSAPFMTSTLQQEAGRKLRFTASRTMRAAQRLYENGYITYMRTDSTTLSDTAIVAARSLIGELYGPDYLPPAPRTYKKKVKNAQEAHEAIRPAGDSFRRPEEVLGEAGADEGRLYELIWKRTVACQMADAQVQSVQVRIEARTAEGRVVEFAASGQTVTFPGFLRAYVEGSDDPEAELENRERPLPPLTEGQAVSIEALLPQPHETQPPSRFTEASLVRRLEELGVGRPSTYASIISTIQDRGYVWKKGSALIPSFKAFAVVSLLEQHFGHLVDYTFTAKMEDELDNIASGNEQVVPWLRRFYFGDDGSGRPTNGGGMHAETGLQAMVSEQLGEIDARAINTVSLGTDDAGREVAVRVGRYGPYLQRNDETVSIPEDMPPDQLTIEKATELLEAPSGDRALGTDPASKQTVFVKAGRFGTYVQLGEPTPDQTEKPKTASLFQAMSADTLTLEEALRLLQLPREVGVDPADGESIIAQNGRYGPYIAKGKEYRSLEKEEDLFGVTLSEALALLAQPKQRRRRQAPEPLRTLGDDAVSGKPITLRKGRFGPYVTDGETNASLRTGDDPETLTPERAMELLQIRRDRGPSTKAPRRKAKAPAKKKATKKKASSKKAAAKSGDGKAKKKATAKSGDGGAKKKAPAKKKATKKKASSKKAVAASDGAAVGGASSEGGGTPGSQPSAPRQTATKSAGLPGSERAETTASN